jgi:hypothetical protein
MSALVASLDNYTNRQMGENGHVEYTWSNCIQEKISQLNFQLTRTDKDTIQKLQCQLKSMLISLKYTVETDNTNKKQLAKPIIKPVNQTTQKLFILKIGG